MRHGPGARVSCHGLPIGVPRHVAATGSAPEACGPSFMRNEALRPCRPDSRRWGVDGAAAAAVGRPGTGVLGRAPCVCDELRAMPLTGIVCEPVDCTERLQGIGEARPSSHAAPVLLIFGMPMWRLPPRRGPGPAAPLSVRHGVAGSCAKGDCLASGLAGAVALRSAASEAEAERCNGGPMLGASTSTGIPAACHWGGAGIGTVHDLAGGAGNIWAVALRLFAGAS